PHHQDGARRRLLPRRGRGDGMKLSLLPRSLYGRLILVLLGGLLLAQTATFFINRSERDQLLFHAGGMRLAQRIADIVQLLDTLPGTERQKAAALFNTPPLRIALDAPPLPPDAQGEAADFRQAMFQSVLQRTLGEEKEISVRWVADAAPPAEFAEGPWGRGGRHRMGGLGMQPPAPAGPSFLVQVPLHDGMLATFDTTLSPQTAPLPLRLVATLLVLLGSVVLLALLAVRWLVEPLSALAQAADQLGQNIDRSPLPET
ncbi:MAG: two-component sensor histidine kinase, partial [Proteobacteria bacterium]|nr:two-component sensor histidine kinase [Pseudomonadota bacterium]